MKELFNATNKSKSIRVQVFERQRWYMIRWEEKGIRREEIYRDVDSAVFLFNVVSARYRLAEVTIGDKNGGKNYFCCVRSI